MEPSCNGRHVGNFSHFRLTTLAVDAESGRAWAIVTTGPAGSLEAGPSLRAVPGPRGGGSNYFFFFQVASQLAAQGGWKLIFCLAKQLLRILP
jgi:hypothetical protein